MVVSLPEQIPPRVRLLQQTKLLHLARLLSEGAVSLHF
jgi:hypothetical protein